MTVQTLSFLLPYDIIVIVGENMKKRKHILVFGIVLLLFGLGIGYAFLTTTLSINGVADVDSNTWNIYWDNVQVTTGSVSGTQVTTAPTIDTNKTTVSFQVNLKEPGEFYEFTVDAKNDGSIDAMIDTITKTTTIPNYLKYTVTYSDGIEIVENQLLRANSLETYKVRLEYRTDINASELPSEATSLSLTFGVTYIQATSSAQEVEHAVSKYTVSSTTTYIGQAIPNEITQYNTASEAMAAFENRQFYLKHTVQGGIVTESYVEFVVTSEMASSNSGMTAGTYTLRGLDTYDENASNTNYCKAEYYNSSTGECLSPYYATNKSTLLSAFGSSNCTESSSDFDCSVSGFGAYAGADGYVRANTSPMYCSVTNGGASYCGFD